MCKSIREADCPVTSLRYISMEHIRSLRKEGELNTLLFQGESIYILTLKVLMQKGLKQDIKHSQGWKPLSRGQKGKLKTGKSKTKHRRKDNKVVGTGK